MYIRPDERRPPERQQLSWYLISNTAWSNWQWIKDIYIYIRYQTADVRKGRNHPNLLSALSLILVGIWEGRTTGFTRKRGDGCCVICDNEAAPSDGEELNAPPDKEDLNDLQENDVYIWNSLKSSIILEWLVILLLWIWGLWGWCMWGWGWKVWW